MNSLDAKKKKQVQEFINVTESNEENALKYLKDAKWNFDQGIDTYFTNPPKLANSKSNNKKIDELFMKYKDPKSDKIYQNGIEKFCADIGINPLDPIILLISFKMGAKEMGYYTKQEFCEGLSKLNCDSTETLKKELPKLREHLLVEEKFKEIYMYTFDFAKEPNCKGLNFQTAQGLWGLFFNEKYPIFQKIWDDFLNSLSKKNDITRDQWYMYYEFLRTTKGDLSKYTEDGAWPVLIDDFVEFARKNK